MTWRVKNWNRFQHFKDRRPPWIKLYRDLLDDPDWHDLDGDDAKHLTMIWVIASEQEGSLPETRKLAFRLRMTEIKTEQLLNRLSHWLYQDDITAISQRYQIDAPETERETEVEKEKESCSNEFERFWQVYPRRVGRRVAEKALAKALKETSINAITEALARQTPLWKDPQFIPHPATWLNQGRWADDVGGNSTGPPKKEFVPPANAPTREELERRYAERGEDEGVTPEGPGVLASGISVRGSARNGMVHDCEGKQATRGMERLFRGSGMEALRDQVARTAADRRDGGAD